MSTAAVTRADLSALTTRADVLERAADELEERFAGHLLEVARGLRDSWTPGQRNFGTVANGGSANFTRDDNPYVFNSGNENSWHYRADGSGRKRLSDYRADYLAWCRGDPGALPLGLDAPPDGLVEAIDLADACRTRAAVDRRIADVLTRDDDEWPPVSPADRAFAEQELVAAIVTGQELVAAVTDAGIVPAAPAPPEPADEISEDDPTATYAVGYARASTEEQATDGATLAAQRAAVEEECARRGWTLVAFYSDTASGKTTARRPGLAEALARVERPSTTGAPARVLVVSRLDRLTRSVADGGRLFDRARSRGWNIVALDLGVDTTTAAGELVANVMVSVGQWERRVISERTKIGLAQKKREGVRIGRPRADQQDARPQERERLERALPRLRALRAEGQSFRKIAAALNDEGIAGIQGGRWHDRSVRLALQRYGDRPSTTEAPAAA